MIESAENYFSWKMLKIFYLRDNKYWAMKRNIYFVLSKDLSLSLLNQVGRHRPVPSQLIGQWLWMVTELEEKVLKDWWGWSSNFRHLSVQQRRTLQDESKLEDRKSHQNGVRQKELVSFPCFLPQDRTISRLACLWFWRIWKCCLWKRPRNFFKQWMKPTTFNWILMGDEVWNYMLAILMALFIIFLFI